MTLFLVKSVKESEDNFNKSVVAIGSYAKKFFLCLLKWRVSDESLFCKDQVVQNSNNTEQKYKVKNIIKQRNFRDSSLKKHI